MASNYAWLPNKVALDAMPYAKARGVSNVARSPRGFMTQWKKVHGRWRNLDEYWKNRRNNFVARHMAQVKKRGEKLWEKVNNEWRPTRRHLALVMWAYSPTPKRFAEWLKKQKAKKP